MKKFTEIFNENRARLMTFIRSRVDSEADAADILQDVFMSLFMQEDISIIEHVSAWLYRAAGNRIVDFGRKRREEPMPRLENRDGEDEFPLEMELYFPDKADSVEMDFIRALVWKELAGALEELPAEQRLVFERTELDGLSFRELSRETGVPVNTLLSRKHYAVKRLRGRLSDVYEDLLNLLGEG